MSRNLDPIEYIRHVVGKDGKGGFCLYAWHFEGNSWFEIATSICSQDDVYDQSLAEQLVRSNAISYRCCKLPVPTQWKDNLSTEQFEHLVKFFVNV